MKPLKELLLEKLEELKSLRLILQNKNVSSKLIVEDSDGVEEISLEPISAISLLEKEIELVEKVLDTL